MANPAEDRTLSLVQGIYEPDRAMQAVGAEIRLSLYRKLLAYFHHTSIAIGEFLLCEEMPREDGFLTTVRMISHLNSLPQETDEALG